MERIGRSVLVVAVSLLVLGIVVLPRASAQEKKPNFVVIMGDDIGIWNIEIGRASCRERVCLAV